MKRDLLKILHDCGVFIPGTFIGTSQKTFNNYYSVKRALGPKHARAYLVARLREYAPPDVTCVAGIGLSGDILATDIAGKQFELCTIRPEIREHGVDTHFPTYTPTSNDVVWFVDDVYNFGTTVRQALGILEPTGCRLAQASVVLARTTPNEKIPVTWMCTAQELKEYSDAQ